MPSTKQAPRQSSPKSNWWIFLIFFLGTAGIISFVTSGLITPASAQGPLSPKCTPPGAQVLTDPSGDQSAAGGPQQDLISASFAEPFQEDGSSKLYVTMKVAELDPAALPANATWRTFFKVGTTTKFVTVFNDPATGVRYEYGQIDPTTGSQSTQGAADGGYLNDAENTLTVIVSNNKVGGPTAGNTLTGVYSRTQTLAGTAGTGVTATIDTAPNAGTASTATYTLIGNSSCASATPTPTPVPTPTPGGGGGPCNSAGVSVANDPANDHNATIGTSQQDIREVLVAEPYFADGGSKLVLTMKVESLDPNNLPANAVWKVYFNVGSTTYFVSAFNDPVLGPSFEYGSKDANNIDQTQGDADGGSFDAASKSISVTVSNNKVGGPAAGGQLTNVTGVTQVLVGSGQVGGSLQQVDATSGGSYTLAGNAACAPPPTPTPTPTGTPSGDAPTYAVYVPPTGLGGSAGEPSIGVNWKTGKIFYIAGTQTLRVTMNDCVDPATAKWEDVSFPSTSRVTLDPILFTDAKTGRTFVNQLLGKAASMVYTDNDAGVNGQAPGDWIQSQGNGINSGVDHQTVGGGPLAPPLTRDSNSSTPYPHGVYYASQDAAVAQAALSLDGGQTFGPAVPMYTLLQCGGIHGHVKVAPDGTAYVPNKSCGGTQGLVVSTNNGASWTVRPVTGSTASGALIDPSVGIATNGTVYFGYVNGSGLPYAAVTHDKGLTWVNNKRIGAELGIVNATFPQMIAGDGDRAAFAFLGSTTSGDHQSPITAANPFKGKWHLYIATTYDGGATWTTVNATPNDPVQQGSICNSGTVTCDRDPNDRNLLDFNDIQIDKQGRVYAAFADGCLTSACINGDYRNNDYAARASFARQMTGKTLFAAFDPGQPTAPKSPLATATRDASGVHLTWSPPSDGGSPITGYNVYRRAQGDTSATLLASVPASQTSYDDATASESVTYLYHVRAVNSIGESAFCPGSEVIPSLVSDPCSLPGVRAASDPAGDTTPPGAPASMDVSSVSVAEPWFGAGVNKLVFTLKVGAGAAPPSSQWYVIWNRPSGSPDVATYDRNYVAMKTSATGAISYEHGKISPPSVNLPTRFGDADAGSFDPATGTITITISNSKIDNVGAGQGLTALDARTFLGRADGQPVTGLQATDTTSAGSYELVGNASCIPNEAPVAALTATPQSGPAPLTVAFDASGSTDADGSITEYTFTFGDGSAPETRKVSDLGEAAKTTNHTYLGPGTYRAILSVKDNSGDANINVAEKLITVTEGGCVTNWALDANGGVAVASSTYPARNYQPVHAIDGDNTGVDWERGGGWNDSTRAQYPDWLEVNFAGPKAIHEIRVYTLQNNFKQPGVPDENTPADVYGLLDFDVQYWDDAQQQWVTLQSITNNTKALRSVAFNTLTTGKIRVFVKNARANFSRIVEVEALGCPAQ